MKRYLFYLTLLMLLIVLVACGNKAVSSPETNATTAPQTSVATAPQTSVATAPQTSVATAPQTSVVTAPQTSAATAPQTSAATASQTSAVTSAPSATTATPMETTPSETTAEVLYPDIEYDTTPIEEVAGEPLQIHWNPYLLSPLFDEDQALAKEMHALIKVILNYRSTMVFSSLEAMHALCDNLFYEFPPSALCDFVCDDESLRVKVVYRLERDAHLAALKAFGARVESVVSANLLGGDDEAEKAIMLYHEISRSVSYFHVNYESWQTNAYYALMGGKSICYGFADAYNYLLRQVGIKAYLVKSFRPSDKAPHCWSMVEIDGKYYHCDPTWEANAFGGEGFTYFGCTDSKRGASISLESATIGEGTMKRLPGLKAQDTRFSGMNGMKITNSDWELDRALDVIVFENRNYPYGREE